ncbi:MAG: hypothetical protein VX589_09360 [Myxococcota bacterium]|nr:hypothetical protein [Myxococcota bacterium]
MMPAEAEAERLSRTLRIAYTTDDVALLGVWGHGDEGWAVGGNAKMDGGVVLHFEGDAVRREIVPEGPLLWWVFGFDRTRLWAVGERGRILRRTASGWATEYEFEDEKAVLYGVWGHSPKDLWAVGGSVRRNGPKGLVLRSDGDGRWRRVNDPTFPTTFNLYKVWGRASDDVMLVGEDGVTIHWNGRKFSRLDLDVRDILFTVHTAKERPWYIVGGTSKGLAFAGDSPMVEPLNTDGLPALNGVTVHKDGSVLAVGGRGLIYLWDSMGDGHRIDIADRRALGAKTLHSIWSGESVWIVGGDLTALQGGIVLRNLESTDGEHLHVDP